MKKLITKRSFYLLLLVIITLSAFIIIPTYAKFSSNYVTDNDMVGMSLDFDIGIKNLEEYNEVTVNANQMLIFDVEINNAHSDTLYYGVWHRLKNTSTTNDDFVIARLDDSLALTSDRIESSTTKKVSIVLENKTNNPLKLDVGVSSSTTSTTDIEYLGGKQLINGVYSINYMKTLFTAEDEYTYYRSDDYREKIKTASFVNYIETDQTKIVASWDISEAGDNSIVAWLENNEESGFYNLYIGCEEKIYTESLYQFFEGLTAVENITFANLETSLTTSMRRMFQNCSSLTNLDLSNFNTSNVINMESMFHNCSGLTSLNLNSFDTSKVTTMKHMFYNCTNLTSIDVGNFDTSSVENMWGVFERCSSLTSLNLSNFNTSNVVNMESMFNGCSNLTSLNLSSFDTNNVTIFNYMFHNCDKLETNITIKNMNSSNVTYVGMFTYAAVNSGTIKVNYTSQTSELVDNMIATKSNSSNVVKGGFKSYMPPNAPNLDNGNLIPVYFDESAGTYGSWKKADSNNTNKSWYDYENKKWANAVIIADSTKKETYQSAAVGTTINDADITAFYVWIPRFKYRVWNINRQGTGEEYYAYPAYSKGIQIEFETGTGSTGNVTCSYDDQTDGSATYLNDICTVNGTAVAYNTSNLTYGESNQAWYTHPAFNFGDVPKTGFWMGKFKPSGSLTNGIMNTPKIIPDVPYFYDQVLSEQFMSAKSFQNYLPNSSLDAHMVTNLEWGAVAYLTHSIYGLCDENMCSGVNHNNSQKYYTGRSSGNISDGTYSSYGMYDYKGYLLNENTQTNDKDETKVASTTKNITGVYDMSGGIGEHVMGNAVNSSKVFESSRASTKWNNSEWYDSSNNKLYSKYYNSYAYGTSYYGSEAFNRARLGDATAEVLGGISSSSSWKVGSGITGLQSSFVVSYSNNWFLRNGNYYSQSTGIFSFACVMGDNKSMSYLWRSSLI